MTPDFPTHKTFLGTTFAIRIDQIPGGEKLDGKNGGKVDAYLTRDEVGADVFDAWTNQTLKNTMRALPPSLASAAPELLNRTMVAMGLGRYPAALLKEAATKYTSSVAIAFAAGEEAFRLARPEVDASDFGEWADAFSHIAYEVGASLASAAVGVKGAVLGARASRSSAKGRLLGAVVGAVGGTLAAKTAIDAMKDRAVWWLAKTLQ